MANAVLYYRTAGTLATSISSLPSNQKLEYDAPDNILEAVNEIYENRINPQPSVNSDGTRKIFLRDDGLKGRRIIIKGRIKKIDTDLFKVKAFRTIPQYLDPSLPHGVFGLHIDNAPFYNIDCDTDRGLMIGRSTFGYMGRAPTLHDFEIELFFGGLHEIGIAP